MPDGGVACGAWEPDGGLAGSGRNTSSRESINGQLRRSREPSLDSLSRPNLHILRYGWSGGQETVVLRLERSPDECWGEVSKREEVDGSCYVVRRRSPLTLSKCDQVVACMNYSPDWETMASREHDVPSFGGSENTSWFERTPVSYGANAVIMRPRRRGPDVAKWNECTSLWPSTFVMMLHDMLRAVPEKQRP